MCGAPLNNKKIFKKVLTSKPGNAIIISERNKKATKKEDTMNQMNILEPLDSLGYTAEEQREF